MKRNSKVTNEYLPLQEKWRELQKQAFNYLNTHPNIRRRKS